jgi:predicted amidohydrolase YtcJ
MHISPTSNARRCVRVACLLVACLASRVHAWTSSDAHLSTESGSAARWFVGGRIRAGEECELVVESLLEKDGLVLALGSKAELAELARAERAVEVDLRGAFAVPGLIDAHGHVEALGAALEQVDLVGVRSEAELVERVRGAARALQPGEWIEGRGWDQNLWEGKRFPTHAALSDAVPEHPVLLSRVDGHAALANMAALRAARLDGVLAGANQVEGGEILLDGEGRATGVLVDAAVDLVRKRIPAPARAVRVRRLLAAQERLLSFGLVGVHDMGLEPEQVAAWRELDAAGRVQLRVVGYLWGNGELGEAERAAVRAVEAPGGNFALRGMKLMVDGALGSRGAALLEDYHDHPGHRGLVLLDEAGLQARLERALEWSLQPAVHAIGDRANRMVLDAIERLQARSPRFATLGVTPSMQPTHLTSDMPWAAERLGAQRLRGAYAWLELAPDLRTLAFGSDFPVESPDPLAGIASARTRRVARSTEAFEPKKALDGRQALLAFTRGAARAGFDEGRHGRLVKGLRCDMTLLDLDPVECDPELVAAGRVLGVVLAGRLRRDD